MRPSETQTIKDHQLLPIVIDMLNQDDPETDLVLFPSVANLLNSTRSSSTGPGSLPHGSEPSESRRLAACLRQADSSQTEARRDMESPMHKAVQAMGDDGWTFKRRDRQRVT